MLGSDPTGRLGHPVFACKHCAAAFTRYPSAARHDPPSYCSNACRHAAFRATGYPSAKPTIGKTCETCRTEFSVNPSSSGARFCSQKCMLVWRGPVLSEKRARPETRVQATCRHCDGVFTALSCRISGGRGQFCSKACNGSWTVRHKQSRVSKAETAFGRDMAGAGVDFEAQARIGRWVVDFKLAAGATVVEYDGEYWHSLPKSVDRDKRKTAALQAMGYEVIRVSERLHISNPVAAVALVTERLKREKSDEQATP